MFACRDDLLLENLALRHQLAIYKRQEARPQLRQQDRLIWILLFRLWPRWRDALLIVQLDTVLRWLWGPKTQSKPKTGRGWNIRAPQVVAEKK